MMRFRTRIPIMLVLISAMTLRGDDTPPATRSPLDELLSTPVSTASKYNQSMSNVAASVTVITAEEIARYGWRSLGEVLTAVRGVYTTSDRSYTYLGVRGIGLPTDYNNRFLILLNGNPLVESVSGSIDVGTGLGIDMATIERIEFVRGPGSVMYGTGAMFGVINLITKDERERGSVEIAAGSGDLRTGSARAGLAFGEIRASAAISWREQNGSDHYYREYDAPETNHGVVRARDFDDTKSLIMTTAWRDLRLLTMYSTRTKGVPTGSWESDFGGDQNVTDGRTLWALSFSRTVGVGKQISARAFYDSFRYVGHYPYGEFAYTDRAKSRRLGAELRYVWDIAPKHRLTTGGEYVANRSTYAWIDYPATIQSIGEPFKQLSTYVQTESQFTSRMSATIGLGYDKQSGIEGRLTPRGALIFRPATGSILKVLYGEAFRSPSVYESDYVTAGFLPATLMPESIRTTEVVFEQRVSESVLATASVFDVKVDDLIRLQAVNDASAQYQSVQYQNVGSASSRGAELQLEYRRNDGLWSYVSYTHQHAREDGVDMTNSPESLIKAGLSTSTANRLYAGLETRYESGRKTSSGGHTDSAVLTNVNFGWRVARSATLTFAMRNVLDTPYATPGGVEHRQDTLLQDGRTFIVGFKVGSR